MVSGSLGTPCSEISAKSGLRVTEFPCDLCLSTEAVSVPHAEEYTKGQAIHICRNCGFVYVKRRRSAKEIANTWSEELFGEGYTARIPAVKARQTYAADFIDVHIGLRNKEVCDIGAGEGQFLEIIRGEEYGAKVFGVEASPRNCERLAELGIPYFNGTIEEYSESPSFRERQADVVTIVWTLENCRSCRDMLSVAHRMLKEDGHVVVATGSRILVPFKKPLNFYLSTNRTDTHAFRFSRNTLQGILAVSGFEVTHVNRFLDSDILCMIAQKRDRNAKIAWQGDDYRKVYDFFERWHRETLFYRKEEIKA